MTHKLLCILVLLSIGCSKPSPPEFFDLGSPTVEFVEAPAEGAVLDNANVSFRWKGSNAWVSKFDYQLDTEGWSGWTSNTSLVRVLDEGDHTFVVKGQYPPDENFAGQESAEIVRTFTVDAIHGPALWLRPRQTTVPVGDTVTVSVMAEDMTDLMLAHLEIEFDAALLGWVDADTPDGSLLSSTGADVVFFLKEDQAQGRSIIDLGAAGGWPHGVSGSGAVAAMRFRTLDRGTAQVSFGSYIVRDSMNKPLPPLNALEASAVKVE